jgi:hypothetical protein
MINQTIWTYLDKAIMQRIECLNSNKKYLMYESFKFSMHFVAHYDK